MLVEDIHNEFDDEGNLENDYPLSATNFPMLKESEKSLSV
jgi:hypothetical protein